jgi:hypothetical protein
MISAPLHPAQVSQSYETVQQGISTVLDGTMDLVQSSFKQVRLM